MPTVFDNIETSFLENDAGNGLKDALKVALRGDFCVGYFNLRGWRGIDSVVNGWTLPSNQEDPPPCRLLVGMQRLPQEPLRAWLSDSPERPPDLGQMAKLRKEAAKEFSNQLTVGYPTDADEAGLKRLVKQLHEKRLVGKLFLKHALHAKLYLAHRNDGFNPIIAHLGSSNLTMAGLRGQEKAVQMSCRKINKHAGSWSATSSASAKPASHPPSPASWATTRCSKPSSSARKTSPRCGRITPTASGSVLPG